MAVYKFSNVSGFKNYQKYNDFLAGNPAVILDKGSMYPLGVFTLSAAQANIDITNIPQTYKHLQLRILGRTTRAANGDALLVEFNGDTANNYQRSHYIYGDGSTAFGGSDGSGAYVAAYRTSGGSSAADIFGSMIIDILDYTSLNKNKTVRIFGGYDRNGGGEIWFSSGLWLPSSIAAINRIKLTPSTATNFVANTTVALYGVSA